MSIDSHNRRPIIIGVGQSVNRPKDLAEIKKPFDLIGEAIQEAEEDSGIRSLTKQVDTLCLVNILSESGDDPPSDLAHRIRINPQNKAYTWIGASAPQWFVNKMAEKIFDGQARFGLICGGEAFSSRKLEAKAKGAARDYMKVSPKKPWMVGDLRDAVTALESKYGLMLPIYIYPLFENALRYHEGLTIEEQRSELGEFCSAFSSIAEKNPYAWFGKRKTTDEIMEVSATNRMISFPYTKSMCSIMEVDQAAAIFMTDVQTARAYGVPEEKWIYLLGSGDASDIWHVTEREHFYSSPSVKVAADMALEQAGLSLQEIDYLEFYSCFPSAPRITRNMLGIPKDDPRPLTVAGGMPSFGGPGNNYALHAICTMVELLRQNPAKIGLVQALSWFISKHSVGIYSGDAAGGPWTPLSPEGYQDELDRLKMKGPPLVEDASGNATVETFTIFHDREGRPITAVIIGRLDDGSRFLAKPEPGERILNAMMEKEVIGEKGKVTSKDDFNIFQF